MSSDMQTREEPSRPGPVAFFMPTLGGGGAETVMATVASGLKRRGWEVDMVAGNATGPVADRLDPGVELVDLKSPRLRNALPGLVRYLRSRRPGVLVSTLSHANIMAVTARRLAGVDTAVVVRQANPAGRDPWAGKRGPVDRIAAMSQRVAYRSADRVIAVSDGVARDLSATLRLPPDRITTIYNPVDTDVIGALAGEKPNHPWLESPDIPVVLAAGRLTPAKDFPVLLSAFAQVRHATPARLLILGEGPERPRLEKMVRDLGLTGQVALPGFRPNPYGYMARAAVFVLSSRFEGMPNALIEALVLGVPLVATDCESGPAEVLDGGRYGALVPVGSPSQMARAISAALQSPRTAPPESATARFSLDRCLNAFEQTFRAVYPATRLSAQRNAQHFAVGDD